MFPSGGNSGQTVESSAQRRCTGWGEAGTYWSRIIKPTVGVSERRSHVVRISLPWIDGPKSHRIASWDTNWWNCSRPGHAGHIGHLLLSLVPQFGELFFALYVIHLSCFVQGVYVTPSQGTPFLPPPHLLEDPYTRDSEIVAGCSVLVNPNL